MNKQTLPKCDLLTGSFCDLLCIVAGVRKIPRKLEFICYLDFKILFAKTSNVLFPQIQPKIFVYGYI